MDSQIEFNSKEYNTVVIAALLHDIGKFLHRRDNKTIQISHHKTSAAFVQEFQDTKLKNELYDLDLLAFLVERHHPPKKQDLSPSDRRRKLINLVKRADEYSCKERELDEQDAREGQKRKAPLDSIFARINIDPGRNSGQSKTRYHLGVLNPLCGFPDGIAQLEDSEIISLIDQFKFNLPDFSKLTSFSDILNCWLNHLQKYLWAVPSDTRYEHSDTVVLGFI